VSDIEWRCLLVLFLGSAALVVFGRILRGLADMYREQDEWEREERERIALEMRREWWK
jgi:hypothetical protein